MVGFMDVQHEWGVGNLQKSQIENGIATLSFDPNSPLDACPMAPVGVSYYFLAFRVTTLDVRISQTTVLLTPHGDKCC